MTTQNEMEWAASEAQTASFTKEPGEKWVHDWRKYVGEHTRFYWASLPVQVRIALILDAQSLADDEHWE